MKNKFWIGFLVGICGLLIGLVGLQDCQTKEEKEMFLAGWGVGTIILISIFVLIALAITK